MSALRHLAPTTLLLLPGLLAAEDRPADLQRQLDELRRTQETLAAQIAELQLEAGDPRPVARAPLVDLAFVTTVVAGTSSVGDDEIAGLQGGGHDPYGRGFSVPNVELILAGSPVSWLTAEVRIVTFIDHEGETGIELEEAFARTRDLPYGIELTAGQFFTPIGRFNAVHPHAWSWLDQPVIGSRVFGGDGMRGQGATLAVDVPAAYSRFQVTTQNARGETMASFAGEEGIAGYPVDEHEVHALSDLVYVLGWRGNLTLASDAALRLGADAAFGPNTTGSDNRTDVYGGHVALKVGGDAHGLGRGGVLASIEVLARSYEVDEYVDGITYPADTLDDWGVVAQIEVGLAPQWTAGLRYEQATGSGESVGGREADPLRDDRWRVSPLITWKPVEAVRLRLQYNLDHADHLEDDHAHTVWLGLDVLLGRHPHHGF